MNNDLFSSNSEIAFLSILIKNPELIYESSCVNISMMSSTPNQLVYSAIMELSRQNLVPEYNLLVDFLKSTSKLVLAGGEQYIEYLFQQDYSVENFTKFKSLIINSYKARSIISITSDIPKLITSGRDINDVIYNLKNEIDGLSNNTYENATFKLSDSLSEVWNEITSRTLNPGLTGITTGFRSLDLFTGGYPLGDFWLLGARPSQGKTAWVCNSLLGSSAGNGIPLIFSLEMNKQTLVERLVSILSSVSLSSIRLGTLNQIELDKIKATIEILKSLPLFVDVNFLTDVDYATSIIRKYNKNNGVNVVWIDYVQLMSERGNDATHELGRISRAMKLLAKDLNIFIGMVAQLNRGVEARDDKRPILSDLRQSGNLEEDADLVAFLYRDDYYYTDSRNKGIMEMLIRKHRNGPVGMIPLKFDPESTKIKDM